MNDVSEMTGLENADIYIIDHRAAEEFMNEITNNYFRPEVVTIMGSNWQEGELLECLKQVSTVRCTVNVILGDAFEIPEETTNDWIEILCAEYVK